MSWSASSHVERPSTPARSVTMPAAARRRSSEYTLVRCRPVNHATRYAVSGEDEFANGARVRARVSLPGARLIPGPP